MYFDFKRETIQFYKIGDNHCPAHFHRAVEILYVIRGTKEVLINGESYTLQKGKVLFCLPWFIHSFKQSESGEQICVVIPCEYCLSFEEYCKNHGTKNIIITDTDGTFLRFLKMLETADNRILYEGIANTILGLYLQRADFSKNLAPTIETKQGLIAQYIDKHYTENLTLPVIAQYFGYTPNHFSMLFKKIFSIGFVQYLNFIRIQKSLPLLRTKQISSIYLYCGFKNPQQYFLYFKRFWRCTPSEYLQQIDHEFSPY